VIDEETVRKNLGKTLVSTDTGLGTKTETESEDIYTLDDKVFIISTDRMDGTSVPFKGQVESRLGALWFRLTQDIIRNSYIESPDHNVLVLGRSEPLPFKVRVEGYLAGELWDRYGSGDRKISGYKFNQGLLKDQKLGMPITILSAEGKDITPEEAIQAGLLSEEEFSLIDDASIAIFKLGNKLVREHGFIMHKAEYLFGRSKNGIVLASIVHTPSSAVFWDKKKFDEIGAGTDVFVPGTDEQSRIINSVRYAELFEKLTNQVFHPETVDAERLKESLIDYHF